jgi:hypothetical protein
MLSEVCMRYRNVRSLRDHVRLVFNRMEGKLEVRVLRNMDALEWFPNPFAQIYSIAIGQME